MDIKLCYRSWKNRFDVYYTWYDRDGMHSYEIDIAPHEVPAVALTLMEIQIQEAQS